MIALPWSLAFKVIRHGSLSSRLDLQFRKVLVYFFDSCCSINEGDSMVLTYVTIFFFFLNLKVTKDRRSDGLTNEDSKQLCSNNSNCSYVLDTKKMVDIRRLVPSILFRKADPVQCCNFIVCIISVMLYCSLYSV